MSEQSTPVAPVPRSFLEYLRAMGPGLVVVLTWLGAGDIVDASVAGGSYGYALMWVLALALAVRWLFVSTIAKYQLCNQHGESVMQGLQRLHPAFPPFILAAAVIFSHIINAYMYQGLGESLRAVTGVGTPAGWAFGWAVLFWLLVFRPVFRRIEQVFLAFLALLSVTLIGAALWSGPDPAGIVSGTLGFRMPEQRGAFHPTLVAVSLIGAVAGSLANLMYPYFIREKGWTTPAHRKVQIYDLALGVLVIILLDLAVWVLGAEVIHPTGRKVESVGDIAGLLTHSLGPAGGVMLYLGVFAAVGSSIVGNALAYGLMATDAFLLWRPAKGEAPRHREHPVYRWMTVWSLFSPLVWVAVGKTSFVAFTVMANAFQVLLLPVLAAAMWVLTASKAFIGPEHRNKPWENLGMGLFLAAALLGAFGSAQSLLGALGVGK
jgi:Mn2+/Fe2+ NRAMP family transporter